MSLACAAVLRAQDSLLPLPVAGPDIPVVMEETGSRFLKPTKSIKPPVVAVSPAVAGAMQPNVNIPTVARLRRLILMPGGLPPEAMREQMAAVGQSRQPVTAVGMTAPAPVLAKLADLFGSNVNDDTQKKVVDAVRQGMSTDRTAKESPRRVEIVGWAPTEGVMTVVVYPES
jgi:hypothetical protein